jgi:hypothetical protein
VAFSTGPRDGKPGRFRASGGVFDEQPGSSPIFNFGDRSIENFGDRSIEARMSGTNGLARRGQRQIDRIKLISNPEQNTVETVLDN